MTQCDEVGINELPGICASNDDNVFSPCAFVHVRMQTIDVEEWRDNVLSTFGGKTHVRCSCNNFLLILRLKLSDRESRKCMKCPRNKHMVCCSKTCHDLLQ